MEEWAHFIGMHALQVLPILSFYVLKTTRLTLLAAIFYGILAFFNPNASHSGQTIYKNVNPSALLVSRNNGPSSRITVPMAPRHLNQICSYNLTSIASTNNKQLRSTSKNPKKQPIMIKSIIQNDAGLLVQMGRKYG